MHAEAQRDAPSYLPPHLREADDYADRVVLMNQGQVVADGSVDDMTAGLQRKLSAQWISHTDPFQWAAAASPRDQVTTPNCIASDHHTRHRPDCRIVTVRRVDRHLPLSNLVSKRLFTMMQDSQEVSQ